MNTKQQVAKLETKPSERWYSIHREKHQFGVVNHMERVSTGSRARPKVRYSQKLRDAIAAAL